MFSTGFVVLNDGAGLGASGATAGAGGPNRLPVLPVLVLDAVPESIDANAFDVFVAAGGEPDAPPNIEADGLELKVNPEDAGYRQAQHKVAS